MNNQYLKDKAYKEALKFKALEEDVIYAKLEKQGFPINLAKEVASNVAIEGKKDDSSDKKNIVWIMFSLWLLLSIATYIITGRFMNSIGLLVIGIPTTILVHLMTTDK